MFTVDRFGYTLIHQTAYFGHLEILLYLIKSFRRSCSKIIKSQTQQAGGKLSDEDIQVKTTEIIKNWVNAVTLQDDGWTALHLSAKTSNVFFEYLIEELGANTHLRNKNGVSLMHKAALDDNNYVLTYLRDKCQMSISEVDF